MSQYARMMVSVSYLCIAADGVASEVLLVVSYPWGFYDLIRNMYGAYASANYVSIR